MGWIRFTCHNYIGANFNAGTGKKFFNCLFNKYSTMYTQRTVKRYFDYKARSFICQNILRMSVNRLHL